MDLSFEEILTLKSIDFFLILKNRYYFYLGSEHPWAFIFIGYIDELKGGPEIELCVLLLLHQELS